MDCAGTSSQKLRVMKCELGCLSRADGSCSFSAGHTSVWASVNGPGDVRASGRLPDKMALDVSVRPKSGDAHHNNVNFLLEAALNGTVERELFPRTILTVTCHPLQSDGSCASAVLTAAGLAILDAGVPSCGAFCGVQVSRVNGKFIVDPDQKDEGKANAHFVFAMRMLPDGGAAVIASESSGILSVAEWSTARMLAVDAARNIFLFYRETLQRKLSVDTFQRPDSNDDMEN